MRTYPPAGRTGPARRLPRGTRTRSVTIVDELEIEGISAEVPAGVTGVVARAPSGLQTPITVTRESGSTAITFAADGDEITASIAVALGSGVSIEAIARATSSVDDAFVGIPFVLTGAIVPPTLGDLTVSVTGGTVGAPLSSTISGRATGSTFALTGAGAAGLAVNNSTGVISGTPTATGPVNIVETLAGATGSPHTTTAAITIAAAVVVTLPRPSIELTSSPTAYPPTISVALPFGAYGVGDVVRIQTASAAVLTTVDFTSPLSDTSITLTANAATDAAAINAALAGIASGSRFIKVWMQRGADESNASYLLHGTAAAPTITNANQSQLSGTTMARNINLSMPGRIFLHGDDCGDFDAFPIKPSGGVATAAERPDYSMATAWQLQWTNNGTKPYAATDFDGDYIWEPQIDIYGANGVVAVNQQLAITLVQADDSPATLDFTDVTGANLGQTYTSGQSITVSGLESGFSFPMTVTAIGAGGTIKIDGVRRGPGTYLIQNGTVLSEPEATAPNANLSSAGITLTCGSTTGNYAVATPLGAAPFLARWDLLILPTDTSKLYQPITQVAPNATATNDPVGYVDDYSGGNIDLKSPSTTTRPLFRAGATPAFIFDGSDDYWSAVSAIVDLYNSSLLFALVLGLSSPSTGTVGNTFFGQGNSASNNDALAIQRAATAGDLALFIRNGANSPIANSLQLTSAATYPPAMLDGTPRVLVLNVNDGLAQAYVDARKQVSRTFTRSGTVTLNRLSVMGWLRAAIGSIATGEITAIGAMVGENLTDGGVAVGAYATGEVAEITNYVKAIQGR